MDNVSRPLIALLVGTAAFLCVWVVALKPSSSSSTSGSGGTSYQGAINAAKGAVAASQTQAAAISNANVSATTTTPASAVTTTAAPTVTTAKLPATHAPRVADPALVTTNGPQLVDTALAHKHVVAVLFYNPSGSDDRAVKQELKSIPGHAGKVVKLAVPVDQIARYPVVSDQVPVVVSPTLVLIDAAGHATTLVGFTDSFELAQRVSDALAVKAAR